MKKRGVLNLVFILLGIIVIATSRDIIPFGSSIVILIALWFVWFILRRVRKQK